ncbi:hypothetical protein AURANDRAFT_4528, partial [Aureococcus anophagefferens]
AKAARLFKRAVELESVDATLRLGHMYEHGYGVEQDAKKADELYRVAADRVPEAIYVLGSFYMVGRYGLQKNTKKAAKIFKRAVELGNADAMSTLGALYKEGNGVKIDKKKALQLWSMASDRGHAYAQLNIGVQLHINGKVDEAFRLFELSARQGLAPAEFELGRRYAAGIGVEPDPNKCVHWLRRAAARGEPRA